MKIVLITGASKGIGRAIALNLSSKDYLLILNYSNDDHAMNELTKKIKNCTVIKADVSKEEEVKKMINEIIKKYQKIDILINNAGICMDSLYDDKTVQNFQKILNTNLLGPFLTAKYASKHMIENKYGKIINISSTNSLDTPYPESADYDASKAALNSLTINMAKAYAPYINVNAIASGWVNTDMNKNLNKEFILKEENKIILKRFAEPKEIASVVSFLISDEASYINGTIIRVDGGRDV